MAANTAVGRHVYAVFSATAAAIRVNLDRK